MQDTGATRDPVPERDPMDKDLLKLTTVTAKTD